MRVYSQEHRIAFTWVPPTRGEVLLAGSTNGISTPSTTSKSLENGSMALCRYMHVIASASSSWNLRQDAVARHSADSGQNYVHGPIPAFRPCTGRSAMNSYILLMRMISCKMML